MTVRVERSFELPVGPEQVWEFISDPAKRAGAISVVSDYTDHGDGTATWQVDLPIPVVDRTIAVETEDESVRPNFRRSTAAPASSIRSSSRDPSLESSGSSAGTSTTNWPTSRRHSSSTWKQKHEARARTAPGRTR
jgi:carbon monoxide dehydrogenase subunit G